MKKLLVLLVLLASGFVNGQNIITFVPSKCQSFSSMDSIDVFEMIGSDEIDKGRRKKPLKGVSYVFDFDAMVCDFYATGYPNTSTKIINMEEKDGLIYVDCDEPNVRTGGRIVTHFVLNPKGIKNIPHMIYYFYWEDINTTYATVTLRLK